MKTALSYIRYSVQKKKEEKESPEIQRRVIAELAKRHDCEILQEYSDLGVSGESIFKREGIQRLMADLRRLRPDYIICQHRDRLGRGDDLAILKIEMRKYNVGIITSQGVIDLSNPYEDVMSDILGAFAKFERQMGSLRARELRKTKALKGEWMGHVPYGYDLAENGGLKVNEREKETLLRLCDAIEAGRSLHTICRELNRQGQRVKEGGPWQYSPLRRLLKSKIYLGYVGFRGEWHQGNHEPLLSEERWNRIQKILSRRSFSVKTERSEYLLTGLLECALCGGRMHRQGSNYACRNYVLGLCTGVFISRKKAEEEVTKQFFKFVKQLERRHYEEGYEDLVAQEDEKRKRAQKLGTSIKLLETKIKKLEIDYFDDGIITRDQFARRNREYLSQIETLKKELKQAEKEAQFPELEELLNIRFEEVWRTSSIAERRKLLGYLIEKVKIYPQKVLRRRSEVHWKVQFF